VQPVTMAEVEKLIRKKLAGRLPDGTVLHVDQTFQDIGLSSLETTDIVYNLEDRLGVQFDPAGAADVRTIGDLIEFANKNATLGIRDRAGLT
jgi:acyl carrier protein